MQLEKNIKFSDLFKALRNAGATADQYSDSHRRALNRRLTSYLKKLNDVYGPLLEGQSPDSLTYDYLTSRPEIKAFLREKKLQAEKDKRTHDREFIFYWVTEEDEANWLTKTYGLPELDDSVRDDLRLEILGNHSTSGFEATESLLEFFENSLTQMQLSLNRLNSITYALASTLGVELLDDEIVADTMNNQFDPRDKHYFKKVDDLVFSEKNATDKLIKVLQLIHKEE